jgi:hypothetical protein
MTLHGWLEQSNVLRLTQFVAISKSQSFTLRQPPGCGAAMNMKTLLAIVLLASPPCWGQSEYTIPLQNANPSLVVPLMAAGNGVLYVAYRSTTWLKRSDKLHVLAYDLNSRKVLRHATIPVPEVRGARAADGLYLSDDGQMLAYAEVHDPCVLLLISTKDLAELRRSTSLPFVHQDHEWPRDSRAELFAGFDKSNLLSFAFDRYEGMRFVRVDPANLKVISNTLTIRLHQQQSESIVWLPATKTTWLTNASNNWQEFTENGSYTDQELRGPQGESYGAVAFGEGKLLAFFGRWDHGTAISYRNHQRDDLNLPCAPFQFGISNDPEYAGADCFVSHATRQELWKETSSEFLLLKTDGPSVIWRDRDISLIAQQETDKHDHWYYQKGNPLIYRSGKRIYVVAVSKGPELKVYVVPVPE